LAINKKHSPLTANIGHPQTVLSPNGGSATLQKDVAQRSVSFFQLCYSKVTVSAEFLNLPLIFFSKRKKNFSVELAYLG
jgi:hypothetical protein